MKNTNNNKTNKNSIFTKKNLLTLIAVIAGYFVIAALVEFNILNRQFTALIVPVGAYIIMAVSLNLVTGFLGELSLGHAGFMSIGAYTGALITLNSNLPGPLEYLIAIIAGGIVAAIFGFLIGVPALRLRGDYLAIVTLAFGEIIRSIITSLTLPAGKDAAGKIIWQKGTMGLSGITCYSNYTWTYIAVVITVVVIVNLVKSRHGRMITSIRDNDIAAESIGVHISRFKILAFVVGAFFAGVAGSIFAHNYFIIKPGDYDFNKSINILVFVVLGGMGNIKGSIIAAAILTVLPEVLRPIRDYRMLMYAILLIVMMLFNESGLKERIKESSFFTKLTGKLKFGR